MWRWRTLVILVFIDIYKNSSSQPITDEGTNERAPRQLDFEECCPCFDASDFRHGADDEEPLAAGSEGMRSSLRLVDDCPCRPGLADSKGASSVFFPTAMRAAGSFLRPSENKEDLKPLFNPEVDLASSVLETLREATDQEYQDALARDAAKSAARAAEDFMFGDATPQESANIVTIVVDPSSRFTDDDDVVPQASHIQQARCINPIPNARSSLPKQRLKPKPSLIKKSKLLKPKSGLLHRNVYDMDNGMGASNVHEHVVPVHKVTNGLSTDSSPLRILESKDMPTNSNSRADGDSNCDLGKVPELPVSSVQNKLRDLNIGRSSLLQSIRDKTTNSLSRLPKLSSESLLLDKKNNNNEDLSSAPSNMKEQVVMKSPYLKNKSPIQTIKPLSLANLLNLKDVELVPLKDLIHKQEENKSNKSKLRLSSIFNRDVTEVSPNSENEAADNKESTQVLFRNNIETTQNNFDDPEGSLSAINIDLRPRDEQIDFENCGNDDIPEGNDDARATKYDKKEMSTEILETVPGQNEWPQGLPTENNNHVEDNASNQNMISDSSNIVNHIIEEHKIGDDNNFESHQEQNLASIESCEQDEQIEVENPTIFDKKPKLKLIDTSAVDKRLSHIKENIAKKLEDLKNMKNIKLINRDVATSNINNEDNQINDTEIEKEDCLTEASVQITTLAPDALSSSEDVDTTLEPEFTDRSQDDISPANSHALSDNFEDGTEYSERVMSMQDLQTLSDAMLQQEEEERESKIIDPTESSEVLSEPSENVDRNADELDSIKSGNTQLLITEKSEHTDNFATPSDEEIACKSNLRLQQSSSSSEPEASDFIANVLPDTNDDLGTQPILQPTLSLISKPHPNIDEALKLPSVNALPLPTLDDLKETLTNLFEKDEKDVEEISALETKEKPKMAEPTNGVMATDASTSRFQSSLPPSKYLKDVKFDILELNPDFNKIPNIPKLGLHSYKTKLPFPTNINLKPIKLQSALENKLGLLGATLSIGEDNGEIPKLQTNFKSTGIFSKSLESTPNSIEISDHFDLPLEATNNIYTTLKKSHKALETKVRKATNRNLSKLKKPLKHTSILETLSRNHEDINDKLRGLHMDLNDRLETMHNELIGRPKLLKSKPFNIQPNFKSPINFNKLKKDKHPLKYTSSLRQPSTRKESHTGLTSRKPVLSKSLKINPLPKSLRQKKFKMPGAASVPIPETVHVPELKMTSQKSTPLTLHRQPNIIPNQRSDAPRTDNLRGQNNNLHSSRTLFGKQSNLNKDNRIKVSFSTTPRPNIVKGKYRTSLPHRNNGKQQGKFDHDGSPSEIQYLKLAVPNSDLYNHKSSDVRIDDSLRKSAQDKKYNNNNNLHLQTSKLNKNNLETTDSITTNTNKSGLQSWPGADESSFLTKVREAVQTRLSKINSAKALKQASLTNDEGNRDRQKIEFQSDMTRSASENKAIIGPLIDGPSPLQENVSYKCKMVCNKE